MAVMTEKPASRKSLLIEAASFFGLTKGADA